MKILHILPALTKGGAEKVVVDLANSSSLQGHDVSVLVCYNVDPLLLKNDLSSTVQFRSIYNKRLPKIFNYTFLVPWIIINWRWIQKFDVLHCHLSLGAVFGSLVYIFRTFSLKNNFIIVETNHSVGMPLGFIQKRAFEIQSRLRDGYVLMAKNDKWIDILVKNKKTLVEFIPNGIELLPKFCDEKEITEFRKSVGIGPNNVKIIGNIGRLVVERKPLIILDIFTKIKDEIAESINVNFLIGGEGEEKSTLQNRINSSNLQNSIFLPGLIKKPLVAMATMDLYISLNVESVTGIAGIEAASQGIPVIAFQMSNDYTENETDWIWSSKDPAIVASKACEILSDYTLSTKISVAQKEFVEKNFSAKNMAVNYYVFYQKVINTIIMKNIN
jgi:glycosyltransferase involved in cell wall biosynthesis